MRRRLANALRISLAGLGAACRHEEAFRLELLLALVLVPLALWLGENGLEPALLLAVLLLVLIMELLNSAVEAIVDRIGPEYAELSARALRGLQSFPISALAPLDGQSFRSCSRPSPVSL